MQELKRICLIYYVNMKLVVHYRVGKHPSNWTRMPNDVTCTLVPLNPSSTEYMTVKNKFEESMSASKQSVHITAKPRYQIVKIERIQNTELHSQYMARKKTMDMKNPPGTINEIGLFHGCPRAVAEKISHQGYNRSFAGKNGKVYTSVGILLNK